MFLVNSRLRSLAAAPINWSKAYSEVTPAILPSSLTKVLSFALVYSTGPPVSVCGTDTYTHACCAFSRHPLSLNWLHPKASPFSFETRIHHLAQTVAMRNTAQSICGTGILTCCPSTTPFGLALGPTNPPTTIVAEETLGFRRQGFSP